MKAFAFLVAVLACVAAVYLVFHLHVPVAVLLAWGSGALCLAWLVLLVTVPWNLHFQARSLLLEMDTARERGVRVTAEREAEVRRIRDRTLRVSVAAHLVSGAVIAVVTKVSGGTVGYYFSGFYVLSTFLRPAAEYFRHLRARLSRILDEVHAPYEDVVALRADVSTLQADTHQLREQTGELSRRLDGVDTASQRRDDETDRRLVAVARRFEETVDRLTDNQEIIAGLKAFLRLVQSPGGAAVPEVGARE